MPVKETGARMRDLKAACAEAWSRETSADPVRWSSANPAWGQCAVTALIIQDYFGGELMRAEVGGLSHYWNKLASGEEIDLTRQQFGPSALPERIELRTREYVLGHSETRERYELLSGRISAVLETLQPARA